MASVIGHSGCFIENNCQGARAKAGRPIKRQLLQFKLEITIVWTWVLRVEVVRNGF